MPTVTRHRSNAPRVAVVSTPEDELARLTPAELRAEFARCFALTTDTIRRCCWIIKVLKDKGQSIQGMPFASVYRRIVDGYVLPEVLIQWLESPAFNVVTRAPVPVQKALVDRPVRVVRERAPGGGLTGRMTDLRKAPVEVVKQVVGPEGIRSEDEQDEYLAALVRRAPAPPAPPAPAADQLTYVVKAKLTAREDAALVTMANMNNVTKGEMARRLIVAALKVKG